ncbi:hypothetical protein PAL_GLEAN10021176 [Pteropus alecto]|uniref:Uncharacterized protein n=1 Tax=Pteropus alecto TaxID=9402 RepID=L5KT38_PTEAL|nr:hypothetical protein PAL_GLEAN10021176 [Pteropus alecto]
MGSSVNSLKSPLRMRKPLPPSGCRRREAHLSGASIAPEGALSTCRIPAPSGPGPGFFILGSGTRASPIGPQKEDRSLLSSSFSRGSFPAPKGVALVPPR